MKSKRWASPKRLAQDRAKERDSRLPLPIAAKTDPKRPKEKSHYLSPELAAGLQELGFHSIIEVVESLRELSQQAAKLPPSTAISLITQQRFNRTVEESLGSVEIALMRDPKILRKALYLLGQSYFHPMNGLGKQGFEIFFMVFLAGELEAGFDTAAAFKFVSQVQGIRDRPLALKQVSDFIKTEALAKRDWRATSLYLEQMSQMPQTNRRDCYQLAKEFYDTVKPSHSLSKDYPVLLQMYDPPWKTLYEAAQAYLPGLPEGETRDDVEAQIERALRDGLYKYTDPAAVPPALRHPTLLRKDKRLWLEFATQSATSGDPWASLALAMYHLRKDGWRPKVKGKKPTDWTGPEWLAVSAARSAPDTNRMVMIYTGLAHLLREHGHLAEGRSWLKYAKENVVEAGLETENDVWSKLISEFEQAWDLAEKGDKVMEGYIKSSDHYLEEYVKELDKLTAFG